MNNDDESSIERVLRAAGGRDHPSEALERHVRAAVHAEWRAAVAQRARGRRRLWLAAAASLVLAVLGLWVSRFSADTPHVVVASVSRMEGEVSSRDSSWIARWISWRPLDARASLRSGEDVMTGQNGRAALTWANGISLRLDRNTRIALVDAQRIDVKSGAVYVDSGIRAGTKPLQIGTPAGAVSHLGTQYEVRLLKPGVRIRVREGRVELSGASGVVERVHAGEQLTVASPGNHARAAIATSGNGWEWVSDVAPPFEIEGRSLREFLGWVSRELGQDVIFASAAAEAEATNATLHGSVTGLAPDEMLEAVLPTTRVRAHERNEQLVIELQ